MISRLQKEILLLQGFRQAGSEENDAGLKLIRHAFPNAIFPLGAIHEFFCHGAEESAATSGFVSAVTSSLMKKGGPCVLDQFFAGCFSLRRCNHLELIRHVSFLFISKKKKKNYGQWKKYSNAIPLLQ
jgi:hypothetical protein